MWQSSYILTLPKDHACNRRFFIQIAPEESQQDYAQSDDFGNGFSQHIVVSQYREASKIGWCTMVCHLSTIRSGWFTGTRPFKKLPCCWWIVVSCLHFSNPGVPSISETSLQPTSRAALPGRFPLWLLAMRINNNKQLRCPPWVSVSHHHELTINHYSTNQ